MDSVPKIMGRQWEHRCFRMQLREPAALRTESEAQIEGAGRAPGIRSIGSARSPDRTSGPLVSSMMATQPRPSVLYSLTRSTTCNVMGNSVDIHNDNCTALGVPHDGDTVVTQRVVLFDQVHHLHHGLK